jgi:hypothetical protein
MENNQQVSGESPKTEFDFNQIQNPYVRAYVGAPIHRMAPKMGRNDICLMEGKKFKNCCGKDGYNFCKKLLVNYLEEAYKNKNG